MKGRSKGNLPSEKNNELSTATSATSATPAGLIFDANGCYRVSVQPNIIVAGFIVDGTSWNIKSINLIVYKIGYRVDGQCV
jgi:hypothetical protein